METSKGATKLTSVNIDLGLYLSYLLAAFFDYQYSEVQMKHTYIYCILKIHLHRYIHTLHSTNSNRLVVHR